MIATRTAASTFSLEFESEDELLAEHERNLVHAALLLPTSETVSLHSAIAVTLRGPWGGEAGVRATVVAAMPGALALGVEGYTNETLTALLVKPAEEPAAPPESESDAVAADKPSEKPQTTWDRIHALSQTEKILLAVKADRPERSLMLQDNDPRVLLSLLRNPRITVEEVSRMARSPFVTYQVVEVIMKAAQWMANPDVRVGLVNNPKTPQAFALRILPTLPDSDVKAIARAGTSMALKQAALRRLQGK